MDDTDVAHAAPEESLTTGARAWATVYLKGICMGAADAVPGVSGGTIALIAGIYERLIGAITEVDPDLVERLLREAGSGDVGEAFTTFREEMDGVFLLVLGGGIVTAVAAIAPALAVAIEEFPALTFGFFFGLIAASAFVLRDEVALDTPRRVAAGAAGFLLAFAISGGTAAALGNGPVVLFLAGAVAICAMVLPGISGSFILLLLGQYEFLTSTLHAFEGALLELPSAGVTAELTESATAVVVFVAGALVGLFTVAHVVKWALDRYRQATLTFLILLIVGALRAPIVKAGEGLPAWTTEAALAFALSAAVGAVLLVGIERLAGGVDY